METARDVSLLMTGALFGAGVAAMVTALMTYFTRFSTFDPIEGEVGFDRFVSITRMAPAEKTAIVIGALMLVGSLVLYFRTRSRSGRTE